MVEASFELSAAARRLLLRRGLRLEYPTLAWNVVGSVLVLVAAAAARSVALAGFGLDSLIEIVTSAVVVWQLKGTAEARERTALPVIGVAFGLLALYIATQSSYVLAVGFRPHHSQSGIVWLALTAVAMSALAYGKSSTGRALGNRVLQTEARVTTIDGPAGALRLRRRDPQRLARLVVGRPAFRLPHRLLRPAGSQSRTHRNDQLILRAPVCTATHAARLLTC